MRNTEKNQNNPFPYSDSNKRYHTYDYDLRVRFGGKTAKLPIDGGFSCPNIDGTKGRGGCTYCSKRPLPGRGKPVAVQYAEARETVLKKWGGVMEEERYLPYFQMFTNTYAPLDTLKRLFEEALSQPHAVGLVISTRADCIGDDTAKYLSELSKTTDLTVELGLQTVHEETARRINRCHTYAEFLDGFNKLEGIRRCVHLIDGLPGEDREMMLGSVREMARIRPEQLKIHLLYFVRGTEMCREYEEGRVAPMEREDYVDTVVSQLELLPPETVIGRVTGDGLPDELVAPIWSRKKLVVLNEIDKLFVKKDSWQGKLYKIDKKDG
ncbi:MAG: TIGR01212 family radical SAM protein [Lachnospiraceae bacterium]|nr:TIGR01212 family radical SAM protein [Lachnospiraceae bacterium]